MNSLGIFEVNEWSFYYQTNSFTEIAVEQFEALYSQDIPPSDSIEAVYVYSFYILKAIEEQEPGAPAILRATYQMARARVLNLTITHADNRPIVDKLNESKSYIEQAGYLYELHNEKALRESIGARLANLENGVENHKQVHGMKRTHGPSRKAMKETFSPGDVTYDQGI